MRSMPNKIAKKSIYFFAAFVFVFGFIFFYKIDNKICQANGFERNEAELNANKRLSYFAKNYSFKNIKLKDAEKSDHDFSWTFRYLDDAKCEVAVNVDSCGATDISGFSAPCLSLKK